MISNLAAPSVCLIDDERDDYEPLLEALLQIGIGCVHIKGDTTSTLPKKPFEGLRVVFADLHLSSQVGKDAASHTAQIFSKVVSTNTAPLVVVIWSKYKDDVMVGAPADDQPTEAELFKSTLLESFPDYQGRLVFIEMEKPRLKDRPSKAKWIKKLKKQVTTELEGLSAFEALWTWESMVRDAGMTVTKELTNLVISKQSPQQSLSEKLSVLCRSLVRCQGGPGCTETTAPLHLAVVLGQCLIDLLEHLNGKSSLSKHGAWLISEDGLPKKTEVAPAINGFLMTAGKSTDSAVFAPGNVYQISADKWHDLFNVSVDAIHAELFSCKDTKREEWLAHKPIPVLIELSPACDVHQQVRQRSLLIGGLVFPEAARDCIKRADALETLPTFTLRWAIDEFPAQNAFIVCYSRFKVTHLPKKEPRWLKKWFRLRELPTAALRNWHAGHAARVGYPSMR